MKTSSLFTVLVMSVLALALAVSAGRAQGPDPQGDLGVQAALGAAFTYQGQLKSGGNPVNGNCDFQFSLWDAASGGAQIGATQTKANVSVSNGNFTITNLDFGSVFTGDARWLAIAVRCPAGSGTYTNLSPPQALTAAPYALGLRPGASIVGQEGTYSALLVSNGYPGGVWPPYEKKAVAAWTSDGTALWGAAGSGTGVYGFSSSSAGVYGAGSNVGVYGGSDGEDGTGVYGQATAASGATHGVYGESASISGDGVVGYASAGSGTGSGVFGRSDSPSGKGVVGWDTATSGTAYGVIGESSSSSGTGVYGRASAGSGTTYGVYGWTYSPNGFAGYFAGRVHVEGNFSVGGSKAFKIDHPLDPANHYLYHFAQEAPQVQNVYNGVVALDANGEAVITLPAYFSALNTGPFRYQLTAIGAPMPNLHIVEEIRGNSFRIAGGAPSKKVSWEVTAVRNDPYLRDHPVQAEVDKPADERGAYLYPAGYGQPPEMGLDYQRHHDLLERQPETLAAQELQ